MIYLIIGVIIHVIVNALFAWYVVNRINRIKKRAEEQMSLWDRQADINDRVTKCLKDAATLIQDIHDMVMEDDGK